jgi:hypothetical protein
MRPDEDAFGQALWAFQNGKSGYEIYETDDGDLEVIEIGAYFATYDDWPQFEKDALERVKGRVLDVGCIHCICKGKDLMSWGLIFPLWPLRFAS